MTLDDLRTKLEDDVENLDTFFINNENEIWFRPAFDSPKEYIQKLTGEALIPAGENYKLKQSPSIIFEITSYLCIAKTI